jgi:archaemetzincin
MNFFTLFFTILFPLFGALKNEKPNISFYPPKKVVYVQTMGQVNNSDLELVVQSIRKFYKYEVVVNGKFPTLDSLRVKNRTRFQSNKILKVSKIINKNLDGKVLILTNYDICTDRELNGKIYKDWGIFGLAGINGKTTVVSTYRMKNNHVNRLTKVTIHELGHTLGLGHCEYDDKCVMNDAKGKGSTVDGVELKLCSECKKHI